MAENSELAFATAEQTDLRRYFQSSFAQHFASNHVHRPGSDVTLTAFAQLATLRLNTTRALISLVDQTTEYIFAEATQRSSLLSDSVQENGNSLWFGCTALPRPQGLCGDALDALSLQEGVRDELWEPSPLIISDLIQDDGFKDQPFVRSHPSLRFYAAMPISARSGLSIGTLSLLDEKPRDRLSNVEITFLRDIVTAIMAHLEITRSQECHWRSEKMIKGLGVFMEGRIALDDWWVGLGNNKSPQRQSMQYDAEVKGEKEGNEPDLDLMSGLKRDIPLEKIIEPEASMLSSSLGGHSHIQYSKPPIATPVEVKNCHAVKSPTCSEFQRQGDAISSVTSKPTGQETLTPMLPHSAVPNSTPPLPGRRQNQEPAGSKWTLGPPTPDLQENLVSQSLKEMFSRASNIIQKCLEVNGAAFLDATGSPVGTLSELTMPGMERERSRVSPDDAEYSDVNSVSSDAGQLPEKPLAERHGVLQKLCRVLGLWTGEQCNLPGDEASEFCPLTETFLQSLLRRYPHGHVFNIDERGHVTSSISNPRHTLGDDIKIEAKSPKQARYFKETTEQAEARSILRMLPGARSVAFVPLWDFHKRRWFAGSFAWVVGETTRVLTRNEDLNYLAAFGNSVVAQATQLDAVGANRAKSNFISSVSHELRSPLHGILASAEFLQDTALDLFQCSMINTIERCGRTLLDTIQHVLDFAKINNLAKPEGRERGKPRPAERERSERTGLTVDADLCLLTEDVIDSIFAGHLFQGSSSLAVTHGTSRFPPKGLRRNSAKGGDSDALPQQSRPKKDRLHIIIDISCRSNWTFSVQSGALRTVLMNLFGNALKYTDSGWVKISLQSKDIAPTPSQSQQSIITISVSDSGRGIAQEYLHGDIFHPFTQENPLNPGTGLGLSTVLQIVRSLGGTIKIKSEQDVGTEVVVSLILSQASAADPLPINHGGGNIIDRAREKTSELSLALVGFDANSSVPGGPVGDGTVDLESSLLLQTSVEHMATDWFGMKVTTPQTWRALPPDIYIANESELFLSISFDQSL
ncbi:hypothetical protein GQ53DRAFT_464296 [Thozetella sp. PMI_491]|nr:hypothetical protein GQ53DRAFT_464296 [Thozetella sp. PMI_491]